MQKSASPVTSSTPLLLYPSQSHASLRSLASNENPRLPIAPSKSRRPNRLLRFYRSFIFPFSSQSSSIRSSGCHKTSFFPAFRNRQNGYQAEPSSGNCAIPSHNGIRPRTKSKAHRPQPRLEVSSLSNYQACDGDNRRESLRPLYLLPARSSTAASSIYHYVPILKAYHRLP